MTKLKIFQENKIETIFLIMDTTQIQSKTCVEHIEQVIDKSLINYTNSLWIYYIFCMWGLYIVNIVKSIWENQIKKLLTFGRIYGYVRFNFLISIIGFKYKQGI